MTLPTLGRTIF